MVFNTLVPGECRRGNGVRYVVDTLSLWIVSYGNSRFLFVLKFREMSESAVLLWVGGYLVDRNRSPKLEG